MKEESMIKGAVDPVNMAGTEKILHQMKNCVCKIKIGKINATGFFCKVPFINMIFLMTNFHVIRTLLVAKLKILIQMIVEIIQREIYLKI